MPHTKLGRRVVWIERHSGQAEGGIKRRVSEFLVSPLVTCEDKVAENETGAQTEIKTASKV